MGNRSTATAKDLALGHSSERIPPAHDSGASHPSAPESGPAFYPPSAATQPGIRTAVQRGRDVIEIEELPLLDELRVALICLASDPYAPIAISSQPVGQHRILATASVGDYELPPVYAGDLFEALRLLRDLALDQQNVALRQREEAPSACNSAADAPTVRRTLAEPWEHSDLPQGRSPASREASARVAAWSFGLLAALLVLAYLTS